jgi:SM-20-related protein
MFESLFQQIANDLRLKGFSVNACAFPLPLCEHLYEEVSQSHATEFRPAGIGRDLNHTKNATIRSDYIQWVEGKTPTQHAWITFASRLQRELNRSLLLGLFSFESHFAHYKPGAFYKRHVDAFKGQANRVLSVVLYLNSSWAAEYGGQLALYSDLNPDELLVQILPEMGTLVVFLSEDFPHEVLPATHDRFSIAGWFRVNTSSTYLVDHPS